MYIENNVKLMFKQNSADAAGSVTPTPSLWFLNNIIIACKVILRTHKYTA